MHPKEHIQMARIKKYLETMLHEELLKELMIFNLKEKNDNRQ